MKYQVCLRIIFLLFGAAFSAFSLYAEDSCEEYSHIKYAISINRNILKYDLSNNGTTEPPYVDSVWIADDNDSILQVYYDIQSQDDIDISFLERGHYVLYVQVGNCVMGRMFIARGTYPTDIDDILELHSQTISKFIRNGQLFIRRGDLIYTIQGQKKE